MADEQNPFLIAANDVTATRVAELPRGKAAGAQRSARGNRLSVVIPVFNEEKGLDALVAALGPKLDSSGMTWEIVFVDDGSRDRSLEMHLTRVIHGSRPSR
jgi:cellulose synthase/poly-beta-1,6-N-acetylglucosamine synthase-like glycosyltransferase